MAKKKKTRQQKIIADLRKQLLKDDLSSQKIQTQNLDDSFEKKLVNNDTITLNPTKQNNQTINFSYLIHDLKKTAMLTLSVIILQIALYILLTNRLLILPGLTY